MIIFSVGIAKELAYLDPGSGSMLLQLILAALLGTGVLLRTQWNKIKSLLKKKNDNKQNEQDEQE